MKDEAWMEEYHSLRKQEGWVLSDKEVAQLPNRPKGDTLYGHWMKRKDSLNRILLALEKRNIGKRIGDLGCGNGWLSHHLASTGRDVTGVDLNHPDIEQANRVFSQKNLTFRLGDENELIEEKPLDLIVISAALQYIDHPRQLFGTLLDSLSPKGEIWVTDTFLYNREEAEAAKKRSEDYYKRSGFPGMAKKYQHHTWEIFKGFSIELIHEPKRNFISKWLAPNQTPFPIIAILKRPT